VVNQHLLADLTQLGLWNPLLKNELVAANGSVQARAGPRRCDAVLCTCMCACARLRRHAGLRCM
jgi:ribonucleoside-diphosphate reductase subunit M1